MNSTIINGIKIYNFSSRDALIEYAFLEKKSLIAINAEKILHADDQMRRMINKNIGYCDGIGTVWALKKKGFKDAVKIPGCELWLDLIRSSFHEKSFYLVGGRQEVIDRTAAKLKIEFPGIRIINFRNGYFSCESVKNALLDDVKASHPDVIFVAIGSPKQELLMEEMHRLHPAVYQGLGGSFDVYIGAVQRAPAWWINNNLEWAYRLIRKPSRIRRQIHLVRFLLLLLLKKI
jgi:UDP-N-acetyl-D-mannosaminouronate:lipid I N-acetyl-D-mannosaminouronosyltransferase